MEQKLPDQVFNNNLEIVIPSFNQTEAIRLDMNNIYTSEKRLIEAKTVNTSTYNELSYTFNDAYRMCKKHLSTIGYQLVKAERQLEKERSRVILEVLPEKLLDMPKSQNNSDFRNAILSQDEEISKCRDRIDMLNALTSFLEGRIKVFENVVRFMNKQIDITIRSGVFDSNKYC